jgi:hypothetical protein
MDCTRSIRCCTESPEYRDTPPTGSSTILKIHRQHDLFFFSFCAAGRAWDSGTVIQGDLLAFTGHARSRVSGTDETTTPVVSQLAVPLDAHATMRSLAPIRGLGSAAAACRIDTRGQGGARGSTPVSACRCRHARRCIRVRRRLMLPPDFPCLPGSSASRPGLDCKKFQTDK